jgi:Galactose oxidase, central domain
VHARVMVTGPGPSARYAHTLALVANRFLVATGGNDGKQTLSDTWALDTSEKPYRWQKIEDAGDPPAARCDAGSPGSISQQGPYARGLRMVSWTVRCNMGLRGKTGGVVIMVRV